MVKNHQKWAHSVFVKCIELQYSAQFNLISDRGKCLVSNFAEELFKGLQNNYLMVSMVYQLQCNGLVERYNRIVLTCCQNMLILIMIGYVLVARLVYCLVEQH
jgi:hypothetical protein